MPKKKYSDEFKADAVALYVSGQMTLEAQYLATKLAKGYLRTVNLGAHLHRIDEPDHPEFVRRVLERLPEPVTIDYVRLNMDAVRPS